jgi:hypothetical protein
MNLRGSGHLLINIQSSDSEVQAFIKSTPALVANINKIFNAIHDGSLGKHEK